ncbi:hypothetical protein SO802_025658 [Lithocarpus litseifolius]|uniref:Multiprotein bridging factor 1 N-terminal domain-containing protein n=1 Tax=Lithocarpus litseifolius TaxID=425828 RepID=A0AAW2BZ08_9ROSI
MDKVSVAVENVYMAKLAEQAEQYEEMVEFMDKALRIGAAVQIVKKAEAGSNKKAASVVNAKKLDEAAEKATLDRVSTEVKQLI